ncbi:MAG TPA: hypothetical protein PKC24_07730 [Cyclobacteriaceae bacterium]|nr:hypothetical protein [Cyclobacteriaceae bacterium]
MRNIFAAIALALMAAISMNFMACTELEEVDPICYSFAGLRHWRVNEIAQTPNTNIEPNSGINLDFIYAISKDGSFAINISNDNVSINWGESWELFISNSEMSRLKEEEWEQLLVSRSPLNLLEVKSSARRELNIMGQDGWITIGTKPEELIKAEASYMIERTDQCKFMVLNLDASFLYEGNTYNISLSVDEPYIFP